MLLYIDVYCDNSVSRQESFIILVRCGSSLVYSALILKLG